MASGTVGGEGGDMPSGTTARPADPLDTAYDGLLARDPVLREISRRVGRPDPFSFDDGGRTGSSRFAAMVLHIVNQQISTKVALMLFDRISAGVGGTPDPDGVVALGRERLHALGLSGAKALAIVDLAQRQLDGDVDLDELDRLGDDEAVRVLCSLRGVGEWTAQVFLIDQLHRPDVLPAGDVGLRHAVQAAWQCPGLPTPEEVRERGRAWAPWRSYAAALLWASLRTPA
jgi:DNA-3-methyladenine glycosylase II